MTKSSGYDDGSQNVNVITQIEYFKHEHSYLEIKNSKRIKVMVDEFLIRGGIKHCDSLLEIGSGYGRFSIELLKRGFNLTPSDISPQMLERLKNNLWNFGYYSEIKTIDIEKPPQNQDKYDVVCGFHTLHHLENLLDVFKSMIEYLNHPGKIVFLEPNPLNMLYYIQGLVTKEMKWEAEKGVLNIRNKLLIDLLTKTGFRNIEISNYGFFPDIIIYTLIGERLERSFNKTRRNPFALYKLIVAEN